MSVRLHRGMSARALPLLPLLMAGQGKQRKGHCPWDGQWIVLWRSGWSSQSLGKGSPAGPFKDVKQLQKGRNRLFSSGGRQDIKWALVGESQVKHRERQSKQSSRSSSASVEVPGPRAGVGWDGRAPMSLLDPVPFLLDPVGIPGLWCGHQLCSSPTLGHLHLPPDLLCCAHISFPSPLPHPLGAGTGFLSQPGRCRRCFCLEVTGCGMGQWGGPTARAAVVDPTL